MTLNKWILAAIDDLAPFHGKGYSLTSVFTHDLPFDGVAKAIKASNPPLTMCVAAQAEVIYTALKLYFDQTGDRTVYTHMPKNRWHGWRPDHETLQEWLWVHPKIGAHGAGHAFERFGIGERVPFKQLSEGCFANFNFQYPNKKWGGHAVVFLAFIDKSGANLPAHSADAVGFRFFSSQGQSSPGAPGGLGERITISANYAGPLKLTPRDAGRQYPRYFPSTDEKVLNGGLIVHPSKWTAPRFRRAATPVRTSIRRDASNGLDARYAWTEADIPDTMNA